MLSRAIGLSALVQILLAGCVSSRSDPPGVAEAAFLRGYVQSERAGHPDFSELTPRAAKVARSQQDLFAEGVSTWGDLVAINFTGGGPQGDGFLLKFQHAQVSATVGVPGPDGKINRLSFKPGPDIPADAGVWAEFPSDTNGPRGWQR